VNGEFPVCESQSQTAIEIPQQQAEDMPFLRRQDTDWLQGFRPAGEIHSRRRQDSVATQVKSVLEASTTPFAGDQAGKVPRSSAVWAEPHLADGMDRICAI